MAIDIRQLRSQFEGLTFDNIGSWPLLPRLTVWVLVVVVCAVAGYFLLWSQ